MAMLKTRACKGSARNIREYLEREGRSLAIDSSFAVEGEAWDEMIDETVGRLSKGRGRSYYHFVISPDPRDEATLEQVRDLATSWVTERYPDTYWVCEYHDDNGIVHAHVVLCATSPVTGRKVHRTGSWCLEDATVLQRLCREKGLRSFPVSKVRRTEDGWQVSEGRQASARRDRARVRAERKARGEPVGGVRRPPAGARWSWLEDIRQEVDRCLEGCASWDEFSARMRTDGYEVRMTHRRGAGTGVTYTHPLGVAKGSGYRVKGWKLDREGGAYSYAGVLSRMRPDLSKGRTYAGYLAAPRPRLEHSFEERLLSRAYGRHPRVGVQDVADACAWMRLRGVSTREEVRRALREAKEGAGDARAQLESAEALADCARAALASTLALRDMREGERETGFDDPRAPEHARVVAEAGLDGSEGQARRAVELAEASVEEARARARAAQRQVDAALAAERVIRRAGLLPEPEPRGERTRRNRAATTSLGGLAPVRLTGTDAEAEIAALERHQRAVAAELERAEIVSRRARAFVFVARVRERRGEPARRKEREARRVETRQRGRRR